MSFLNQFRDPEPPPAPQPSTGRGAWEPTAYAQAALNAEVQNVLGAPEGTRNDALNKAAFNLAQLIAGGQISAERVIAELTAAGAKAGLLQRETANTIRSGLARGGGRARTAPERPLAAPQRPEQAEVVGEFQEVSWGDFWAADSVQEWILEPLLLAGGQTVIYSSPKVGKSLLCLEIAVAIATGTRVLGAEVARRSVLYVDHENRLYGDVRERLIKMGHGPDTDLTDLHYYHMQRFAPLDTPLGAEQLMHAVDKCGAEVVIIDTVSRTISGEENDNNTWLRWYANTGKALKAAGVSLLRLDHTGKNPDQGQRGGSAKEGDVDMVWRLETVVQDKTYMLTCAALSRVELAERSITIHRLDDPLRHQVDASGYRGAMDAKRASLLALLDETGAPLALGVREATDWLRSKGVPCPSGMITKPLLDGRRMGTI